jgi:hypothetical protein
LITPRDLPLTVIADSIFNLHVSNLLDLVQAIPCDVKSWSYSLRHGLHVVEISTSDLALLVPSFVTAGPAELLTVRLGDHIVACQLMAPTTTHDPPFSLAVLIDRLGNEAVRSDAGRPAAHLVVEHETFGDRTYQSKVRKAMPWECLPIKMKSDIVPRAAFSSLPQPTSSLRVDMDLDPEPLW